MLIAIAISSIFGITLLVWLGNRMLPFWVCPICAGVLGTWIGLIIAHLSGYPIDLTVPALLMGGSVVGIVYQFEKKLPAGRSPLLLKTLLIPAGFIAAYSILVQWWGAFLVVLIFLLGMSFIFLSPKRNLSSRKEAVTPPEGNEPHSLRREELENKMKNCC